MSIISHGVITMSYQEKNSLVSFFSTVIIYGAYCLYVFLKYQEGTTAMSHDLFFWGRVILIFIPISIAARIIIYILFHVVNTAVTREDEDPSFQDERDRLIDLRATKYAYVVSGFGFLFAMVTLVLRMPPAVMINVIFLFCNIGSMVEEGTKFYFYRRGF